MEDAQMPGRINKKEPDHGKKADKKNYLRGANGGR
jgi:hypothetical protein